MGLVGGSRLKRDVGIEWKVAGKEKLIHWLQLMLPNE